MATSRNIKQTQWHEPAEKIDWLALLSPEDLQNLAGFFDVLIEMDFETKQQQEREPQNDSK